MKKNELLHKGVIWYLQIPKPESKQLYEPVSYEHWKMLRDLEPTKFRNDYFTYVKIKEEAYNVMLKNKKESSFELLNYFYDINYHSIEGTKKAIQTISEDSFFEKWLNKELVEQILKY